MTEDSRGQELKTFERERSRRIIDRFKQLEAQGKDQKASILAGEVRRDLERKETSFCYLSIVRIAKQLLKLGKTQPKLGTIHFWYAEGYAVIVVNGQNRLDFIDATGCQRLGLRPDVTTIKKGKVHEVFGNPQIAQSVTPALDPSGNRVRGVAFPRGDETPVSSLEDIFNLEEK